MGPGYGLGLTITKLMTEMMGGTIRVESRLGKGSSFTVRLHLPAAAEAQGQAPEAGRVTGYRGPARTVLVVDDDESHRNLVRDLLAPLGFNVASAASGAEGLQRAARLRPDVVLLDVTMPGMSGWEVAQALRELPGPPGAILMMSAAAAVPEPQAAGPEARHDGFIVKPFQVGQLLDVLSAAAGLTWTRRGMDRAADLAALPGASLGPRLADLQGLASLGLIRPLGDALAALREDLPESLYRRLSDMLGAVDMEGIVTLLEEVRHADDAA